MKPICPKNINDLKNPPLREYFIYDFFERYTKYHEAGLVSIPEPHKNISPQAIILKAISTFKVKANDVSKVYTLVYRL